MTRKSIFIYIFKYVCKCCGHTMYVPRRRGFYRKAGHIKHMYCPKCMEVTAHREKDEYNTRWHGDVS